MKYLAIKIIIAVLAAALLPGCAVNIAKSGGGGHYVTRTEKVPVTRTVTEEVPPAKKVGLEVFGSQPSQPPAAAKANRTTWGATHGGLAYNEMRPKGYAMLQNMDPNTPIYIDPVTGFIWKVHCLNRVVPAASQTFQKEVTDYQMVERQEFVPAPGGNINQSNEFDADVSVTAQFSQQPGWGGFPQAAGCIPQRRVMPRQMIRRQQCVIMHCHPRGLPCTPRCRRVMR